jgi:hypothetical protein
MMSKFLLAFVLMILSRALFSQDIVTDRPDQTETSSTIPFKSLQTEAGFLLESSKDATSYLFPTVLFRYGILDILEVRLNEQFMSLREKKSSETYFGLSDLEPGIKVQILKKEEINTEIAFITHLILPTVLNGQPEKTPALMLKFACRMFLTKTSTLVIMSDI